MLAVAAHHLDNSGINMSNSDTREIFFPKHDLSHINKMACKIHAYNKTYLIKIVAKLKYGMDSL